MWPAWKETEKAAAFFLSEISAHMEGTAVLLVTTPRGREKKKNQRRSQLFSPNQGKKTGLCLPPPFPSSSPASSPNLLKEREEREIAILSIPLKYLRLSSTTLIINLLFYSGCVSCSCCLDSAYIGLSGRISPLFVVWHLFTPSFTFDSPSKGSRTGMKITSE